MIEFPHTAAECGWALKQMAAGGSDLLAKWEWGCKDDVHIGWAVVDGDSKFDAQAIVPQIIRMKTRVVALNKVTMEEIEGKSVKEI